MDRIRSGVSPDLHWSYQRREVIAMREALRNPEKEQDLPPREICAHIRDEVRDIVCQSRKYRIQIARRL